ncbi:hypothetical protein [Fluviispira sanaruensis]|uniref:Lipoprotein n=1 Tax=Fluviispira sanaruensis TaxID=2493639 RepID=A0A4P2VKX4_FLUSA|nr:hypothetical protein [Fluviispira sanaruensis]BBH53441.1 hypothetical protein JCM31447_18840 [Fluviispira sanaruensis]
MIKKRILVTTSCFFSSLALVGCGGKKNINMQTSSNLLNDRWDTFAKQICLPLSEEIPNSSDPKFMEVFKKILSTNPKCFNPNSDPNSAEQTKYLANRKSVNEYVAKMAQKITATEIISFEKLSDAAINRKVDYQDYDLATENDPRKYALPYVERKDENATNNQDDNLIPIELSQIKTASGLNQNSEFNFFRTTKGKLDNTKNTRGTAYVLKYRLADNNIYTAIITIPKGNAKVPLMLYAHGGDTGISFRELATLLQDNLINYIVAAPAFPGEPICSVDKTTGKLETGFKRYCVDNEGKEIDPAVDAIGEKSPLDNDVVATLGLHSALKRISLGELKLNNDIIKEFFVHGNKGQPRLEFYVEKVPSLLSSYQPLLQKITGPKTVATASSRGGATLLAAIGRSGIMLQQALAQLDNKDFDLKNIIIPPLFSSAATYYAPTTLLMGKFRILFKDMLNGKVSDISHLNSLPMIPDLQNNQYFANFRNSDLANNQKKLNELIGFLGASDVTYLAPYISVATQNWTNNLDNILDLEKLVAANSKDSDRIIKKVLGILGGQNISTAQSPIIVKDFLGNFLTAFIDHKEGEKSLLKHFSEALKIKNESASKDPCSIDASDSPVNYSGDCSIRGIFTKGVGTLKITDGISELNIKGIIEPNDEVRLQKLSELFSNLADDKVGLINFTDALTQKKNDESIVHSIGVLKNLIKESGLEISTNTIKSLLTYLTVSTVSAQTGLEPSIIMTEKLTNNALYILFNLSDLKKSIPLLSNINYNEIIDGITKDLKKYIKEHRKASPGSLLLMHNTQDQIVDHTQSLIAKTAFDTVFSMSFGTGVYSFPLNEMNIPPIGTQFIAFQPEKRFYSIPVGGKYDPKREELCIEKNTLGNTPADYNVNEKKCFDKKSNIAHGDPSFLTGKIINSHLQNLVLGTTEKNSPLAKAFLYGYDAYLNIPSTSISTQIKVMNDTYYYIPKEVRPKENTYPLLTKCVMSDANCFIFGASVPTSSTDREVVSENTPLFTRTLYQDALKMSSLKGGVWDKDAEEHDSMTPTDVMSMWLKTSAKATLSVQK